MIAASTPWRRVILVAVALLATASTLSGYVLLSPRRTWSGPVQYWVDGAGLATITDGDRGVARVMAAIVSGVAWNGAGSGLVVKSIRSTGAMVDVDDGIPMIQFSDPFSACIGPCLATTFTSFYRERVPGGSYEIVDADIVTNSTGYAWTSEGEDPGGSGCWNEVYVEGVMVHEVGHGLGLAHSAVAGATMNATLGYCQNHPLATEADDDAGLRDLYGTSPCTGCAVYTWYLTPGASRQEPRGGFYTSSVAGNHIGRLRAPAGADFDLYLDRWTGSAWVLVASASGGGASEDITYPGAAGSYRWRVRSFAGAGEYHFWMKRP
jgi:hypothetical protein